MLLGVRGGHRRCQTHLQVGPGATFSILVTILQWLCFTRQEIHPHTLLLRPRLLEPVPAHWREGGEEEGLNPPTSRQFTAEPRVNKQQLAVKTADKVLFTMASSGWREAAGRAHRPWGGTYNIHPHRKDSDL